MGIVRRIKLKIYVDVFVITTKKTIIEYNIGGEMSAAHDIKKIFEEELWSYFEREVQKVAKKKVTPESLKSELLKTQNEILKLEDESEFFESEKPKLLLKWSNELLERLDEFEGKARTDILAAISYFVNEDDMISDNDIFEGFDDDFMVMENIIEFYKIKLS
jgi:hypothetical protein